MFNSILSETHLNHCYTMSLCPKCGRLLDDDAMFCSKCGARVGCYGSATPPPLPGAPEYGPHSAPQPQSARFSAPQHRRIEPGPLPSRGQWANAGTVLLILLVLAAVGLVAYLLFPHSPVPETPQLREVVTTSDSADPEFDAYNEPDVAGPADDGLKPIGHADALQPNAIGDVPVSETEDVMETQSFVVQRDESTWSAQEPGAREVPQRVFKSVEQKPSFPGGDVALKRYISSHLQYPSSARESHIEGTVVVQLLVTATGRVDEVNVIRSVDRDLDREAVRVCRSLPNFVPGRQNGQAVNAFYTLPVMFKLQQ